MNPNKTDRIKRIRTDDDDEYFKIEDHKIVDMTSLINMIEDYIKKPNAPKEN